MTHRHNIVSTLAYCLEHGAKVSGNIAPVNHGGTSRQYMGKCGSLLIQSGIDGWLHGHSSGLSPLVIQC